MGYTRTGKGGNMAVVVTEFNQDNPAVGLQVVDRDIPTPRAGNTQSQR